MRIRYLSNTSLERYRHVNLLYELSNKLCNQRLEAELKFHAIYRIQSLIVLFTGARHWTMTNPFHMFFLNMQEYFSITSAWSLISRR